MKGYVKPEIEEITGMMEMVELGSGHLQGGGSIELEWEDHDSGCFSTLRVRVRPGEGNNRLMFKLYFVNHSMIERKIAHVDEVINDYPNCTAKVTDNGQAIEVYLEFDVVHKDSVFSFGLRHMTFSPGPYDEGTPRNTGEELGGDRVETGAVGWVANFNNSRNGVRTRYGILEAKKGDASADWRIG